MKLPVIASAITLGVFSASARAQFSTPDPPKVRGITTPAGSGDYLAGSDDCASPHRAIAAGPQTGVPFTTGTTGTTGQSEANCYAFGTSGITDDVWFDWQATQTGDATLQTCGGTSIDTKIAVYPLSSCPADGSSLACNDDACGLQSSVTWQVTSGTTYTFQVGTFPGASGGSGTLTTSQSISPPCGVKDVGISTNALGLTAGGETGWIKVMNCMQKFTHVSTTYGTAGFPGSVTNGARSQIVAYTHPTATPSIPTPGDAGWMVLAKIETVVMNGDTDIFNQYDVGHHQRPPGTGTMVLASAEHVAGQFPAGIDSTSANPNSWVVGQTSGAGGVLNTTTLSANNVPPTNMTQIGFPSTWLLRLTDDDTGGGPGTSVCFGDGTGIPCPCGNTGGTGQGCANSVGSGAILSASGTASVSNRNLTFQTSGQTNQPGLLFQGVNTIGGGAGLPFGDGIRCCGTNVIRIDIGVGNNSTTITTNSPTDLGVTAGDKRCYQKWYRDPPGPCSSTFNLSNAVSIIWQP